MSAPRPRSLSSTGKNDANQHRNKRRKMSENTTNCNSLIDVFHALRVDSDCQNDNNENDNQCQPQEPHSAQDLTCRSPQTAGDTDNSDATDTSSNIIVVVDSSNVSSVVSVLSLSSTSESVSQSEPEDYGSSNCTIPETDSDTNGNIGSDIMDNCESTPIKRKHETYSSSKEQKCFNDRLGLNLKVMPLPVVTTRSGRTVRARFDQKFDYSSELQDDSDDLNDPNFKGDEDNVNDDNDDDEDYNQQQDTEPTRKQRRISMRNSCCSSSDGSSTHEPESIIYLDLTQPVAIVSCNPKEDTSVECDGDLKIRLQKILGLATPQRRLYNPMSDFELEAMDDEDCRSMPANLWNNNLSIPSNAVTTSTPQKLASSNSMTPRLKTPDSQITNDIKMLLIDDLIERVNANYFESQTPDYIKEPIDLSGLPSEQQRALTCQQHKRNLSSLKSRTSSYSFLNSLKLDTPLNMCHPLALTYRKNGFDTCKIQLAKTLFNMLNHTIFYCGLRQSIAWKRSMNTPSSIVQRIQAGGQRIFHIILWQHIKEASILVKTLVHEMCHAAAFVFNGETGHGDNCRKWAYRAKSLLPELPQINDCNGGYKYTCLLCRRRSVGIIKFEDEAQHLRCNYCQFEINVESYNDKNVHSISLVDQVTTPYKEFVRANYLKSNETTHSSKMRVLNAEYRELQLQTSVNKT